MRWPPRGKCESAVLICGTGIGMAITANKVKGIRAAQCHDTYSAERARKSNDAQIVTLGARVIGPELAKVIVHTFLAARFSGGPSAAKVERILACEAVSMSSQLQTAAQTRAKSRLRLVIISAASRRWSPRWRSTPRS